MSERATWSLRGRNPDILSCIASLSNDEVFTPPEFANRMLDTLAEAWAESTNGANIWADSSVTFLDPCTKSGVFLREITRRLTEGLASEIPDLQERVDHILTKQVFGIAITRLTALMARRSLYCSKHARGTHSIAKSFASDNGNIWFERTEHTWNNGRCSFCGASAGTLDRSSNLETHAYAFIHADDLPAAITEMFGVDMQFDVIIGNPPYQLQDAGHSASAVPIYHHFVEQAIELEPRYVVMVTPSRWFIGGKGLDDFRRQMLADRRIRHLVDYVVDKDAFPNINVNGGVSYFLWDRDTQGMCELKTFEKGAHIPEVSNRFLDEYDVLIRREPAVSILRKVQSKGYKSFAERVSARKPFGLPTNFHGRENRSAVDSVKLHGSGAVSWVSKREIVVNRDWIDKWKVLVGRATDGNENYPLPIWDQRGPFVAAPNEACTETYLVASLVSSEKEAKEVIAYMRTKFFRFLVSLRKITQDNKADVFGFVPDMPADQVWTDDELRHRFSLQEHEWNFIDAFIREMEWSDEAPR